MAASLHPSQGAWWSSSCVRNEYGAGASVSASCRLIRLLERWLIKQKMLKLEQAQVRKAGSLGLHGCCRTPFNAAYRTMQSHLPIHSKYKLPQAAQRHSGTMSSMECISDPSNIGIGDDAP